MTQSESLQKAVALVNADDPSDHDVSLATVHALLSFIPEDKFDKIAASLNVAVPSERDIRLAFARGMVAIAVGIDEADEDDEITGAVAAALGGEGKSVPPKQGS